MKSARGWDARLWIDVSGILWLRGRRLCMCAELRGGGVVLLMRVRLLSSRGLFFFFEGKCTDIHNYLIYRNQIISPRTKHAFRTYADGSLSIAHIDKNMVPPRHNLDAVIRCISYVEGFSPCIWHQRFPSIVSKSPIADLDVWGMQHGCPGS
jgi:hypothetical protein